MVALDVPVTLFGLGLVALLVSLLAMHPSTMPTFHRWWHDLSHRPGPATQTDKRDGSADAPGLPPTVIPPRRVITGRPARLGDPVPPIIVDGEPLDTRPADRPAGVPRPATQDAGLARHIPIRADGPRQRTPVEDAEAVIDQLLETHPEHLAAAISNMIAADDGGARNRHR